MQSATNTHFKQKKCPKCGNNHDNEGILCSFCIEKADIARSKIQTSPENFWVKCLIEREGNTTLNQGNIQYTFKPNERGDSVCEIINQGHYSQIIKSEFYEPYVPSEDKADDIPRSNLFSNEDADLIDKMIAEGKKVAEIAALLSETSPEPIPWQRVMKYQQSKAN
jgi:hypothetical protein